jgi:large repetitive protein
MSPSRSAWRVSGSGTSSVTISSSLANVNAALATLTYNPPAGTNVISTTLTVATNDNGNTGTGGSLTDSDQVVINVM